MKKISLLFILSIFSIVCRSQWASTDCIGGTTVVKVWDSFSFETVNPGLAKIVIDTTFPGNIWQVGMVQKAGFPSAYSGVTALQTDTITSYDTSNTSAVIVYADTTVGFGTQGKTFSMTFWHYYDTDTLSDSCILQMTLDSGKTWLNSSDLQNTWPIILYAGSLNNYSGQPYLGDKWCWSGHSNGWHKESFCIYYMFVKGIQIPRHFGFRFLFVSDTVQTGRPGWMIDDIRVISPMYSGIGIKDVNSISQVNLYPNPTSSGIFTFDYPFTSVKGTILIHDIYGRKVKTLRLKKQIDVSDLPKGLYLYSIAFDDTEQQFRGSFVYE